MTQPNQPERSEPHISMPPEPNRIAAILDAFPLLKAHPHGPRIVEESWQDGWNRRAIVSDARIAELEETARVAVDQFERMDKNLKRCSDERNADLLRIAELEAEVARYRRWQPLLDVVRRLRDLGAVRADADQIYDAMDRITGLRFYRSDGTCETVRGYVPWQDQPELSAQSPTPPAPVAQENSYPADEPRDLNGRTEFHRRLGLCACGVVLSGRCPSCAERKEPKPPEAEEPAIVQALRAHPPTRPYQDNLEGEDIRELLAFIDAREGGEVNETLCAYVVAAEQERDRLREELTALKARPVVDVTKIRADVAIAESWVRLIQRDAPDVVHGPSQQQRSRDALRAIERALESLQPASAKVDERPAPMPSAEPSRVDDGQQERRLDAAWDQAYSLAGNSIRNLVEYLRAEREGRKA